MGFWSAAKSFLGVAGGLAGVYYGGLAGMAVGGAAAGIIASQAAAVGVTIGGLAALPLLGGVALGLAGGALAYGLARSVVDVGHASVTAADTQTNWWQNVKGTLKANDAENWGVADYVGSKEDAQFTGKLKSAADDIPKAALSYGSIN